MSRLTLRLPETLHQQLVNLAQGEGISLNQFIVYALTRQVTNNYQVETITSEKRDEQKLHFERLLNQLGKAESEDITKILSARELSEPEPELTPDAPRKADLFEIAAIKAKIAKKH